MIPDPSNPQVGEPPIIVGVEMPNGRRFTSRFDERTARFNYPDAVRIGPARVVFVEDEQ